jgi:hypothetical protein
MLNSLNKVESGFLTQLEDLFLVKTRSTILNLESLISNLVLLQILIQLVAATLIYYSDVLCNNPLNPLVNSPVYVNVVCGSHIKANTIGLVIEIFLFFGIFLSIFLINKKFLHFINRYHVLTLEEDLPEYIHDKKPNPKKNYYKSWKKTLTLFLLFKIISTLILIPLVIASTVLQFTNPGLIKILGIDDKKCGPYLGNNIMNITAEFNCHYPNEYLIYISSNSLSATSILISILYFFSIFFVMYYIFDFYRKYKEFKKSKSQKQEFDQLQEQLLSN